MASSSSSLAAHRRVVDLESADRVARAERLASFRRFAHAALARVAFVAETAALSAAGLVLLSFLVVRADPLATVHEWGSFLNHYVAAAPAARHPVDLFLLTSLAVVFAVNTWIRLPAARRAWATSRSLT